jgi:hypothetical protein
MVAATFVADAAFELSVTEAEAAFAVRGAAATVPATSATAKNIESMRLVIPVPPCSSLTGRQDSERMYM